MTENELDELLSDCPILYHMAEQGSWPSIRRHGLLSTTALLDRHGVSGAARAAIESSRRPVSVTLERPDFGRAVVRDQSPMDDRGLRRCLEDGLSPEQWYQILNAKVFFWLSRGRLLRLLNAEANRLQQHDVLALDTRALAEAYSSRIWLCPINSGCTTRFPRARGVRTFQRIVDYPYAEWRAKRRRGERVVELAVDYAVPDVARFVTSVVRMRVSEELGVLFRV